VTSHPLENIAAASVERIAPELLQKFYASTRFIGRTPDDDRLARERLGYYCDLQSLNSEDAVTWSFFGTLAYMPAEDRQRVCSGLFERLDLPAPYRRRPRLALASAPSPGEAPFERRSGDRLRPDER
jgi:hypothetical protein